MSRPFADERGALHTRSFPRTLTPPPPSGLALPQSKISLLQSHNPLYNKQFGVMIGSSYQGDPIMDDELLPGVYHYLFPDGQAAAT